MVDRSKFEYCIREISNESSEAWIYISDNGSGGKNIYLNGLTMNNMLGWLSY